MPKGKKNKGKYEHKRTEQAYSSDEDAGIDMPFDNCSETSAQSDLKSVQDEAENDLQEKFEEKVLDVIEALNARANAARATAMTSLRSALQRRVLTSLLANQRATLADHVTKALRRGKDGERKAAAGLAPLLALQIGEEGAEEYVREVRPALTAAVVDKTASVDTRTECCNSLSVLCYLLEEDISEILEVMRVFETIYSGSYLKGDGSVKVTGAAVEEGSLHAAALEGWALLLTVLPPPHAAALLPAMATRLAQLLHAQAIEVRLAAGTALAIAHECCADPDGADDPLGLVELVLPRLDELAKESHKFRAKRDRKIQRATFRDILKYFEEDEIPTLSIRVGSDTAVCDGWGSRAAYGALAAALGAGLQTMALESGALRAALRLPEPTMRIPGVKLNKLQRHLANTAASKARTVARNKNRDKRSAALAL